MDFRKIDRLTVDTNNFIHNQMDVMLPEEGAEYLYGVLESVKRMVEVAANA